MACLFSCYYMKSTILESSFPVTVTIFPLVLIQNTLSLKARFLLNLIYCELFSQQMIPGNSNTFTVVEQRLDPPVLATKIRIVPFSEHVRTVCMRVELVGFRWHGKLIECVSVTMFLLSPWGWNVWDFAGMVSEFNLFNLIC